jgi:hypothetical protein
VFLIAVLLWKLKTKDREERREKREQRREKRDYLLAFYGDKK